MRNQRSDNGGPILLGALAVVLVLLAILFLHNRGGSGSGSSVPPMPTEAPGVSSALDINVYLDGSGSIRHFLDKPSGAGDSPVPPNYVKPLLDKTETTLHNAPGDSSGAAWRNSTLRFFRFGSAANPTPIPSDGGLQQMSNHPEQFAEANTRIETPVGHTVGSSTGEPRAELKIIMTDLYQSGGQLERPADALADRYLRSDTGAVGIVAVRSSFTGPVEDLPGTPRGGSLPGAADSMPFYILFAGEAPDVRHAMEVLIAGTGLRDAFDRRLATEFLFTRAPLARGTEPMRFSGADYSLVNGNLGNTHMQQIALGKGVLRVKWTDPRVDSSPFVQLGDSPVIVPAGFHVGPGRTLVPDTDATDAARPCAGGEPLCVMLDREALKKGTIYVFRFDAVEQRPADTLAPGAPALRGWNIEDSDAERISATPPHVFPAIPAVRVGEHPGLTPDLSKFLSALQGEMFHAPVRQTSYYLSVQAN